MLADVEVFISNVLMERMLIEKYGNHSESMSCDMDDFTSKEEKEDHVEKIFIYLMECYRRVGKIDKEYVQVNVILNG